eukprot:12661707-Alexandrium_andersonii.AAC.1
MQLSAALGGVVQLCALSGTLSRWQRAPSSAHNCAPLPKAADSCTLQRSAALGCITPVSLLGRVHSARSEPQ